MFKLWFDGVLNLCLNLLDPVVGVVEWLDVRLSDHIFIMVIWGVPASGQPGVAHVGWVVVVGVAIHIVVVVGTIRYWRHIIIIITAIIVINIIVISIHIHIHIIAIAIDVVRSDC